jgi:signal transduction histidine kinase
VAGVAHEINNPLTYLMGNMELAQTELERSSRPGEAEERIARARHLLRTSVEGGERIAKIVRALRAVSRSQSQDEHAPVRLNAVAGDVHELMRTGIPPTLDLVVSLAKEDPVVQGNSSELYQVLLNLATNAIQAMGTRQGRVTIETRLDGDAAILSVHDDGPGIPGDVRGRLFTAFYTTKPEGTGLGLSLAHAIVREHGGEIEVESEPGRGAVFRVRLPRMKVAQPGVKP